MNNKRSIATALAVVAIIALASVSLGKQGLATVVEPQPDSHRQESGAEEAHGDEDHAKPGATEGHADEEGQLQLSAQQISAAGIELALAAPRLMSTSVTFPGEIQVRRRPDDPCRASGRRGR